MADVCFQKYATGERIPVRLRDGRVDKVVIGRGFDQWPHRLFHANITVDHFGLASELTPRVASEDDVVEILTPRAAKTLTAADLDGMRFPTADGGVVGVVGGHGFLVQHSGYVFWTSGQCPPWRNDGSGSNPTDIAAIILKEYEQHCRNPPIEIAWIDIHKIGNQIIFARCEIRDDHWSIVLNEDDQYVLRRNQDLCWSLASLEIVEGHIRKFYAEKAAESA